MLSSGNFFVKTSSKKAINCSPRPASFNTLNAEFIVSDSLLSILFICSEVSRLLRLRVSAGLISISSHLLSVSSVRIFFGDFANSSSVTSV